MCRPSSRPGPCCSTGHNRKTDADDVHAVAVVAVHTKGLRVLPYDVGLEALRMLAHRRLRPSRQTGPLVPLTNPQFLFGIAGAHTLVVVALMLFGVIAATLLAHRLVDRGRIPGAADRVRHRRALANTMDRALHGNVQDGHVLLNLADIAIIVGLAVLAASYVRTKPSSIAWAAGDCDVSPTERARRWT